MTQEGYIGKKNNLIIRMASIADAGLIQQLAFEIWPHTYASILSQDQISYMLKMMYSIKVLAEQMENNQRFVIVYKGLEPIGFASYGEMDAVVYKLHKLYILPSQHGQGAGKFLIESIIEDLNSKGAALLRLNVNRKNTAVSFYKNLGFEIIRSEDSDIGEGFFMNDYIMEKNLATGNP